MRSLFGNSYEDAVYRKNYNTPIEREWYEIPRKVRIIVNCNNLSYEMVEKLFTKLVNGDGAINEDDIIVNEEENDKINAFEIIGEYDYNQSEYITDKLDKFDVYYKMK